MLELSSRHALGVMVRGALAHGFLSGRYFGAPPPFAADDIRSRLSDENYGHDLLC